MRKPKIGESLKARDFQDCASQDAIHEWVSVIGYSMKPFMLRRHSLSVSLHTDRQIYTRFLAPQRVFTPFTPLGRDNLHPSSPLPSTEDRCFLTFVILLLSVFTTTFVWPSLSNRTGVHLPFRPTRLINCILPGASGNRVTALSFAPLTSSSSLLVFSFARQHNEGPSVRFEGFRHRRSLGFVSPGC